MRLICWTSTKFCIFVSNFLNQNLLMFNFKIFNYESFSMKLCLLNMMVPWSGRGNFWSNENVHVEHDGPLWSPGLPLVRVKCLFPPHSSLVSQKCRQQPGILGEAPVGGKSPTLTRMKLQKQIQRRWQRQWQRQWQSEMSAAARNLGGGAGTQGGGESPTLNTFILFHICLSWPSYI